GFGGQSFMPEVLDKVRTLREEIDRRRLDVLIQIDGGIDARTIGESAAAGCDVFLAGAAVYGAPDPDAMIETPRAAARDARARPESAEGREARSGSGSDPPWHWQSRCPAARSGRRPPTRRWARSCSTRPGISSVAVPPSPRAAVTPRRSRSTRRATGPGAGRSW